MSTITTNKKVELPKPPLKQSKTFEGKIDSLIKYLYIGTVRVTTKKLIKGPVNSSKMKIMVETINIPTGTLEYITSYMNTSWEYLEKTMDDLLNSNAGFYNTRKILNDCKIKCYRQIESYELSDSYTFDAIHSFIISNKLGEFPVLFTNLIFEEKHLNMLRDHCKVRSAFLKRLHYFIDYKLTTLLNLPEVASKIYEWDSPQKEMEISEFLYALKLSGRIKILTGSEEQFRQQFFNFFGLEDKDFNKRTHDLRRRKSKSIFLSKLVEALEK
jgi:hypothetical protein